MSASLSPLPPDPRVLVIVMRRLGDVLVTTPLIRRLRAGLPGARVDVLVLAGTEGMLAGNPDIGEVIAVAPQPSAGDTCRLIARLWRRYDVAVSTQTGDRPTFLAFVAGRRRIGLVPARGGGWWKRLVLDHPVTVDPGNHRVIELMRLAAVVGAAGRSQPVVPGSALPVPTIPGEPRRPYAVLHANPMYRYKRWSDAGWRALARALVQRGLAVVVTGAPDPDERAYLDALWGPADPPVERLDGRLDWPQLAALIGAAAVYVGTDTSMSHLAAGTGCPTVAIFGPVSPHLMGPWPLEWPARSWAPVDTVQHRGNVWIVQKALPCQPCEKLGCERHYESYSRCLDELSVDEVLLAVDQALRSERALASQDEAVRA
jgi:heptosyltransferase-3